MKEEKKVIKRLYFDCETSPNVVWSWNIGYNLNIGYENIIKERAIICICYKWEGSDQVHSLTWTRGDDASLVKAFAKVILEADEVVGHNGDNFDLKWFRTRALFNGIKGLPDIKSIDTLKISKDKFRFNSNRLDYIAKYLGLGAKIKTTFDLWKDVIAGDAKSLKEMVDYCKKDVILLEKVYNKLEGYTKHKTHVGVMKGGSKCDCPKCGSTNTHARGNYVSAAGVISKRMQCQNCGTYYRVPLTTYKKDRGED